MSGAEKSEKRRPPQTYRVVPVVWWSEAWFRNLSSNAKLVWLNAVTGRQSTAMPGLSLFSLAGAAEELGLVLATVKKAMAEIVDAGAATFDPGARVFYSPVVLESSPPSNPKVVTGWRRSWADLPECEAKRQARKNFDTHCRARGWDFGALVEESDRGYPDTSRNPSDISKQEAASKTQDSEPRSSKQAPAAPPRGGREAGRPDGRPPRAAAARAQTESGDEGSDFVALNALADVTPREHKLGDIVRLAETIERRWKAWASERPDGVSDLDQAIRANYPRLVERLQRGGVTSAGGMFVTLLEDLVDPAALEAELDRQQPDRVYLRKAEKQAKRTAEQRAADDAADRAEELEQHARFEAEAHDGESRAHFDARRRVEHIRSLLPKADPQSFLHRQIADAESALEKLEAHEAGLGAQEQSHGGRVAQGGAR